jgi:5-hydroxyisourate hydrolase
VSEQRSRVTTHVLDATSGRPATGIEVTLERQAGADWQPVGSGRTDADGRIGDFGPADLERGVYRVSFAVAAYFAARQLPAFYPEVVIIFTVHDVADHYHVPLLLSPYAYSTYRGS